MTDHVAKIRDLGSVMLHQRSVIDEAKVEYELASQHFEKAVKDAVASKIPFQSLAIALGSHILEREGEPEFLQNALRELVLDLAEQCMFDSMKQNYEFARWETN